LGVWLFAHLAALGLLIATAHDFHDLHPALEVTPGRSGRSSRVFFTFAAA